MSKLESLIIVGGLKYGILIIFITSTFVSSAQPNFIGVKSGLNLSNITSNDFFELTGNQTGLSTGIFFQRMIGWKYLK